MGVTPVTGLFNSLQFGTANSATFGVFLTGEGVYSAPERAVEFVEVPGRNGALIIDQGRWQNIEVTYPASIAGRSQADFRDAIREFRNAVIAQTGYQRMTDTYNPDEYRLASAAAGIEVEPAAGGKAGEFEITLNCKPQRFLAIGETPVTIAASGDAIENPTALASQPIIKVTGAGTLTIGSYTIAISTGATNPVYIDCDMMEAYEINSAGAIVDRNSLIEYGGLSFPQLEAGENVVTWSGDISAVEITPRWWRL